MEQYLGKLQDYFSQNKPKLGLYGSVELLVVERVSSLGNFVKYLLQMKLTGVINIFQSVRETKKESKLKFWPLKNLTLHRLSLNQIVTSQNY